MPAQDIDELDKRMTDMKAQTERLLGQALGALRDYTSRGNNGA